MMKWTMLPQTHYYYYKVYTHKLMCLIFTVIFIPGLLSPVGSLKLNLTSAPSISLTWTEPFSLDITGVDSDITCYCVEVVIDMLSSSTHCGIDNTGFQYTFPPSRGCHKSYLFIVAPINIVGIGLPANVSYFQELTGDVN